MHVHFEEPGPTAREGYWTGTRAAAAGGITMVVEHPLSDPPTTTAARYAAKRASVERSAHVDFALWGGAVPGNLSELAGMANEGAPGFKIFMVGSEPEFPALSNAELAAVMSESAALGTIVVAHAEDQAMTDALAAQLEAEGRHDPLAWAESRPSHSEVAAVRTALTLAKSTRSRVQLAHLSTSSAVRLVADAQRAGVAATCETCPHFLLLDERDLIRHGVWAKTAPPLRPAAERERLWAAVERGEVNFLASDHAPWEPDEKTVALDSIWQAPNGLQSLQFMTVLTLEAWKQRKLPLERWVSMTSAGPARALGLFPRKGAIVPGSDADLVIYRRVPLRPVKANELLNRHKWTPFEGMNTSYEVRATIVRGRLIFAEGEIIGPPQGQFVALGPALERKEDRDARG
jgi:allantoinase